MKKLLLILSAVFVSVMAWAQNNADAPYLLNPYAYDLTSSWDESTQKLTINFKLNSAPNLHSKDINDKEVSNGRGIQVFLVDSKNNEYYICGPSQDDIRKAHGATGGRHGSYSYTIDLTSGLDRNGKLIPRNEDLTWKVRVNGRKNNDANIAHGIGTGYQNYSKPRYWPIDSNPAYQKRLISHSIDVVTNPQAPNFGRIMITDGIKLSTDNGWGEAHTNTYYSYTEGRGLYILEPDFVNFANNGKRAALNSNKNGGFVDPLEPREVCVSDNGRIFVSSASKSETSATAVWELSSNYKNWTEILTKSTLGDRRVVAMDTKGAGDAITLLLLCAPKNANTPLTCYEYNLQTQALTTISLPNNVTSCTPYVEGINFQAKVQYASNGDIWVGLGNDEGSRVVRVVDDYVRTYGSSYGGEAFVIKDNLMIKSSRTSGDADILFKKLNDGNNYFSENITGDGIGMASWITDFAIDYADNVFVASNYYGRVIPISMPYDGVRSTPAPLNQKFKLKASYPNILATDLKYEPEGTTDKYTFSFITNTKPTEAEIRFYKKAKRGNMDRNIATIHADNYDETQHATIEPDYVYTFQRDELKQGLMKKTFKMVGGEENTKELTDALPPGEMYWSVYVKTDKSTCFAPIYRSESYSTGTFHPLHATVNNYPETDMFGSLFVANNPDWNTDERKTNGLLVYGLNPSGNANEFKLDDRERYEMRANYLNERITSGFLNYPRRMAVAPDGKVYIADEGANPANWVGNFKGYKPVVVFSNGGIKVWDPKQPAQISTFTGGKINTASGVAFWGDPTNKDSWKIYYSNTYDEYAKHNSLDNYTEAQQDNPTYNNGTNNGGYGWNGLVVHQIGNSTPLKELALGMGDASGNISVVAMEKGVWLCQHREHTVAIKENIKESYADNMGAYLLSFVPYEADSRSTTSTYNPRTWTSCTTHGITWSGTHPNFTPKHFEKSWWSQTQSSPLQSTPGGGLAYRKIEGEEFLFVVNHDGNIVKIKIDGWTGSGKLVKPTMTTENDRVEILQTPGYTKCTKQAKKDITQNGKVVYTYGPYDWRTSYINSMEFDYAGNLVTVTGSAASHASATHEIIIYTMPYDRTNAQEIRAPESCIYIPERLHQIDMDNDDIQAILDEHNKPEGTGTCAIDLYRPLQGGMFNTICLPFTVPMNHENNPLAGSEVGNFTGATIESIGGENILCLEFAEVINEIQSNIPYIIKPQQNIKQIMRFNWPVTLAEDTTVNPMTSNSFDNGNTITYQGILPQTKVSVQYDEDGVTPLTLILVAENRLAELLPDAGQTTGTINGLRGYFQLAKKLSNGTILQITPKQSVSTSTTIIVDGKRVNIEKYLREGRVYIRVGDTLYTMDGQKVE